MRLFVLISIVFFTAHVSEAKSKSKTQSKTTALLDSVNKINSRGPACAPSPTATSTTEEQEKIYTDFLWKFKEMVGVSAKTDWTWLRLVITSDFLKPLRDKRTEINRLCKDDSK